MRVIPIYHLRTSSVLARLSACADWRGSDGTRPRPPLPVGGVFHRGTVLWHGQGRGCTRLFPMGLTDKMALRTGAALARSLLPLAAPVAGVVTGGMTGLNGGPHFD